MSKEEIDIYINDPKNYVRFMEKIAAEVRQLQRQYDLIAEEIQRAQDRNGALTELMYRRIRMLKEMVR
jgi:hypothetical protein